MPVRRGDEECLFAATHLPNAKVIRLGKTVEEVYG